MKVIVFIQENLGGCELYRLIYPYGRLKQLYPDNFTLVSLQNGMEVSEYIESGDIFVFHKNCIDSNLMDMLKSLGKIIILDLDDDIELPEYHVLYKDYKKGQIYKNLLEATKKADYLTFSTEYLKNKLGDSNSVVFPNSIPEDLVEFKNTIKGKIKIGYFGSSCHIQDVKLLNGLMYHLRDYTDLFDFYLFGYNRTNQEYDKYVELLTTAGKYSKAFYVVPTVPVMEFYSLYKHINIAIAPLVDDEFNKSKSSIKFCEAANVNIPLIASDVPCYSEVITDDYDGYLCRDRDDFVDVIKYLLQNPDEIIRVGNNAFKTYRHNFSFESITNARMTWLSSIFAAKNTVAQELSLESNENNLKN